MKESRIAYKAHIEGQWCRQQCEKSEEWSSHYCCSSALCVRTNRNKPELIKRANFDRAVAWAYREHRKIYRSVAARGPCNQLILISRSGFKLVVYFCWHSLAWKTIFFIRFSCETTFIITRFTIYIHSQTLHSTGLLVVFVCMNFWRTGFAVPCSVYFFGSNWNFFYLCFDLWKSEIAIGNQVYVDLSVTTALSS